MAVDKLVDSTQLDADLTSVANAIRTKGGTSAQMAFPAGFVQAIGAISVGDPDAWIRPAEYPDYDAMNLSDFEGIYLTYDLRVAPDYAREIKTWTPGSGYKQCTVDRGHFNSSGNFVVDATYTTTSYCFQMQLDSEDGDVQIWRISCPATYVRDIRFDNRYQPCVEIYEKLRIIGFAANSCPYTVKSFISNGVSVNSSLYDAFDSAYGLEQFIIKNADAISITDSRQIFSGCYMLKKVDFGNIDTLSNDAGCFVNCVSLKKIKVPSLTLSSSNALNTFARYCYSLEELDLRNIDATGVLSIYSAAFEGNNNLKILKMSGVSFDSITSSPTFAFKMLWDLYPPMIPISQTWDCPNLSHESLLRLFNVLPTVEATQTLTIGNVNTAKVTAEEIAIATAKGWTVA